MRKEKPLLCLMLNSTTIILKVVYQIFIWQMAQTTISRLADVVLRALYLEIENKDSHITEMLAMLSEAEEHAVFQLELGAIISQSLAGRTARLTLLPLTINDDLETHFSDIDVGDSLVFTASNLPSGVALSSTGILSGAATSAGSFDIVITVTDSANATVFDDMTIIVTAVPGTDVYSHSGCCLFLTFKLDNCSRLVTGIRLIIYLYNLSINFIIDNIWQ